MTKVLPRILLPLTVFAAGRHSNTISVFAINPETGKLTFQRKSSINLPSPMCILLTE